MPFLTDLNVKLVGWLASRDRAIWELTQPLVYHANVGIDITVPTGFQTDFCSVPREALYGLFGDRLHRVGVLHDFLYCIDSMPVCSFHVANQYFREAGLSCFSGEVKPEIVKIMADMLDVAGMSSYHKRTVTEKLI
jgi:hypothetical protein